MIVSSSIHQSKGECRSIRQQSPKKLIMETATGRSCSKPREGYICERKLYHSVSGRFLHYDDNMGVKAVRYSTYLSL